MARLFVRTAARRALGDKPQELPGETKYTEGCKLLAEGKLAKGDLAKGTGAGRHAFKEAIKKDRAIAMADFKRANAANWLGQARRGHRRFYRWPAS